MELHVCIHLTEGMACLSVCLSVGINMHMCSVRLSACLSVCPTEKASILDRVLPPNLPKRRAHVIVLEGNLLSNP